MDPVRKLRRATNADPCPICSGNHKCSYTQDGRLVLCGRTTGPVPGWVNLGPAKNPVWNKYKRDEPRDRPAARPPRRPPAPVPIGELVATTDAQAEALDRFDALGYEGPSETPAEADARRRVESLLGKDCCGDTPVDLCPTAPPPGAPGAPAAHTRGSPVAPPPAAHTRGSPVAPPPAAHTRGSPVAGPRVAADGYQLARLADALGLPHQVIGRLPGVGWSELHGGWVFPEVDGQGEVIGHLIRYPDGAKRMAAGGHRGLTLPGGVFDDTGPLFLVEGPSDTLALLAVGLSAIGRPSNMGGVDHLVRLLANAGLAAGRAVVVVGDNDRTNGALWPGRDGAVHTAVGLAKGLGRRVYWAVPPADFKDCRAWVTKALGGPLGFHGADELGRRIARTLTEGMAPVDPPNKPPLPMPAKFPPLDGWATLASPGTDGVKWVWDGFLAREAVTLLSALPKAGKTTLLTHLLAALPRGGSFCGKALAAGRAVVISEEPTGVWAARRDQVGATHLADDAVRIYGREKSAKCRGTAGDWAEFLQWLGHTLAGDPCDLVVFDTLANLWPVRDENSATEVGAALAPLHALCNGGGRAVLLVHHLRKSDGGEGTAARGSGALAGFVDVLVELRRAKPDPTGRRRTLTGYGRYAGIPPEWTVELAADGHGRTAYRDVPALDPAAFQQSRFDLVDGVLPVGPPGLTLTEVVDALAAKGQPVDKQEVQSLLRADGRRRWGSRRIEDKAGKPYGYFRRAAGDGHDDPNGEGGEGP